MRNPFLVPQVHLLNKESLFPRGTEVKTLHTLGLVPPHVLLGSTYMYAHKFDLLVHFLSIAIKVSTTRFTTMHHNPCNICCKQQLFLHLQLGRYMQLLENIDHDNSTNALCHNTCNIKTTAICLYKIFAKISAYICTSPGII